MLQDFDAEFLRKRSVLLRQYQDSFLVFYETKVGINKMSSNLSMPVFYVTSLSPSIIGQAPESGIDFVTGLTIWKNFYFRSF